MGYPWDPGETRKMSSGLYVFVFLFFLTGKVFSTYVKKKIILSCCRFLGRNNLTYTSFGVPLLETTVVPLFYCEGTWVILIQTWYKVHHQSLRSKSTIETLVLNPVPSKSSAAWMQDGWNKGHTNTKIHFLLGKLDKETRFKIYSLSAYVHDTSSRSIFPMLETSEMMKKKAGSEGKRPFDPPTNQYLYSSHVIAILCYVKICRREECFFPTWRSIKTRLIGKDSPVGSWLFLYFCVVEVNSWKVITFI